MLPLKAPLAPMLAKAADRIPTGDHLYEPKWDGFRCIIFRDAGDVTLGSRGERDLTRYFPELVDAVRRELPERCVVDGEIVVAGDGHLDFEALQQRIHPAESRVRKLATETPSSYVAFDLLTLDEENLCPLAFRHRRRLLVAALSGAGPAVHLTPATDSVKQARRWFDVFEGAGLDGIVAKSLDGRYRPSERAMVKVKHERTADCVVGGYRVHKDGNGVGSLLLGLHDEHGTLQYIGVTSSFAARRRRELAGELAPYRTGLPGHPWGDASIEGQRLPGGVSRWSAGRDTAWEPVRPELVAEVGYDQLQGDRLRHAARFRRWRPDRDPSSCRYDQLDTPVRFDLAEVLAGGDAPPLVT
jgi:ATP-dependent DNA ligase